ncbi:hypothetical protein D030_5035B, partial [Vibrio parahaemolyticus AQ3810]
GWSARFAAGC